MKKISLLLIAIVLLFSVTSCFEDADDNLITANEINDFVWKGLNAVYLYKSENPDLANDRFSSNEDYANYLNGFETPEILFESLKYLPETVDRFSRITSNYFDLLNQQQGTSSSKGIEFNLYFVPGSETEVFGAITLVLNTSVADNLGVLRGQIFRTIDGTNLTANNFVDLLSQSTYTLGFADYNTMNTAQTDDDTLTLNDASIALTSETYTENPVHITKIIELTNDKVGYLMYNGFNNNFETDLNAAFATFKAGGITELVLDLRYNGGGSVQTAAYLGSMVTGQFNNEVYSKLFYNEDLQSNNTNFLFENTLDGGAIINSLNLTKLYVLTTNNRTASASELVINSLKAYIDVVVIGENTVGKTQASILVYDSPNFGAEAINPNHTYAMQPLVANSTNVNDVLVPSDGLVPNIEISELPSTLNTLGDISEPLLAAAIANIEGASGRFFNQNYPQIELLDSKALMPALEQDMFIEH